jgi:hypothetical protein
VSLPGAGPKVRDIFLQAGIRPNGPVGEQALANSDIRPQLGALPNITVNSVPLLPPPSSMIMIEVIKMWNQVLPLLKLPTCALFVLSRTFQTFLRMHNVDL